ncbi:hypothetical protein [Methylomagnum sp.]
MNAQFLVNATGHKTAVVLPIEDFRTLLDRLEELEDLRLIEERKSEPRIAIESLTELTALVSAL